MARLGIDLSGDSIALAEVRAAGARLRVRGYAVLAPVADRTVLADVLRRARDEHRFPSNAEVVAWAGEPRVSAVRAAGYGVERVILPGAALARVSRWHHGLAAQPTGEVEALVSLDETSGAMAIVRDGTVWYEAPLTWSSNAAPGGGDATGTELLRRYAFLAEMTELLHAAFASVRRSHQASVSRILTCGSVPDLRSLTLPFSEEFGVPVVALDSAERIDVRRVRGRTASEAVAALPALQIAMVASRRWHQAPSPMRKVLRIAVPIGVAAAAYGIYAAGPLGRLVSHDAPGLPGSPGPSGAASAPGVPSPPVQTNPSQSPATGTRSAAPPPPPAPAGDARPRGTAQSSRATEASKGDAAPVSVSLSSILWSSNRQLAIIEGQVRGVGDSVAGMTIVEIQPNAVIFRDRAGRLRRAVLRNTRVSGSDEAPAM